MSILGGDDPSSERSHAPLGQNLPRNASSKHAQTLGGSPVQLFFHSLQQISDMQRPASAQRFGVRQNGSGASRSQRTHLQEVGKPRESCGRNQTCGSPSGHQPFMLRSSVVRLFIFDPRSTFGRAHAPVSPRSMGIGPWRGSDGPGMSLASSAATDHRQTDTVRRGPADRNRANLGSARRLSHSPSADSLRPQYQNTVAPIHRKCLFGNI